MTQSLLSEDEIARLVDTFYARVRADDILGPIFNGAIADWPEHLERLTAFWSSVMLSSGRYKGQPMVAHVRHIQHMVPDNFARWLGLWNETAAELLTVEAAAAVRDKAERIAESLLLGTAFYRERHVA